MDHNKRSLEDANLTVALALPAAAANATTAFLNLGAGRKAEGVILEVDVPALPNLVDAKTVTLSVLDSADGAASAAVATLKAQILTGAGGAGSAAARLRFTLPEDVRQYVAVNAAVLAAGGDNTGSSITVKVLN